MKSGLDFLIAARQCEIGELEQLAQTSELAGVIGRLTHALQRERGISNIFLGSAGQRFAEVRRLQINECRAVEEEVRAQFDLLDTDANRSGHGARLYSRIAVVLHELDALDNLRDKITKLAVSAREATDAYIRLVAGLLAVVFEAADSATDPEISRELVAMFHYMQGKEFAGQERAFGAGVFASGAIDDANQRHWRHLIESQTACFAVFHDFADAAIAAEDQASQDVAVLAELERMRRIALAADAGGVDRNFSQPWYDCCTRRIDAMRGVEEFIAHHLRALCESKIVRARAELRDHEAIQERLAAQARATPPNASAYGPNLERSILGLVQEQSRRIQAMSDELETVRSALSERKTIERAKGLLMAHRQVSEPEAHKALRDMAMNQKRRLVDVAEAMLSMAEMWSRAPRH